jgi:hypothetical protein
MQQSLAMPLMLLGAISAGALLWACGSGDDPVKNDPCPNGLCTTGSGGAGTGGNAATTGSSGCVEAWLCSPWETNGTDDQGTRTCVDQNNCGTEMYKPVESATLPALDFNFYKCNVEPIMDQKCSQLACHGTEQGRALRIYARGRHRIDEDVTETGCLQPGTIKNLKDVCIGSIECICWTGPHTDTEWRRNYDSARGFGLSPDGTPIPAGMEATSELLAQPVVGGKAHAGIHVYREGDADYQIIIDWLAGATLGTCNTTN